MKGIKSKAFKKRCGFYKTIEIRKDYQICECEQLSLEFFRFMKQMKTEQDGIA